jgi:hypothetical protein
MAVELCSFDASHRAAPGDTLDLNVFVDYPPFLPAEFFSGFGGPYLRSTLVRLSVRYVCTTL